MPSTDSTDTNPDRTGSQRKGYTPPKGRPTRRNIDRGTRTGLSSTVEWIVVVVVLLLIFAAIFYFGRDVGRGGGVSNGAAAIALVLTPSLAR